MVAAVTHSDVLGLKRPAGELDVSRALMPYRGSWSRREAAHLLRRAGFGGTPGEIARLAAMPFGRAVESVVRFPSTEDLPAPADIYDSRQDVLGLGPGGLRALDPSERRAFFANVRKREVRSMLALRSWWLDRMRKTPAALQEKMTLFFHGHFTTAAIQKGVTPAMAYEQNRLFRSYALGNLRELTRRVSVDPAMLIYLDNARNEKRHPNENYAREMMELFTLGVDQYTEEDVRQAARAWTGWTYNRRLGRAVFVPGRHDDGVKTFLGQTGKFNGDDVVDIVFSRPQCARFIATGLLNFFLYNDPEPQLVEAFAAEIRRHDYDLAPAMATLFASDVFFSGRAYRALVKSPVEFVVGTYRVLGIDRIGVPAQRALAQMGQILFAPPNVAGWPGGENWLTSDTLIARENFVARLVQSEALRPSSWIGEVPMNATQAARTLIATILTGDASPAAASQLGDYLDGAGSEERVRGGAYLTMAMPAYQLA